MKGCGLECAGHLVTDEDGHEDMDIVTCGETRTRKDTGEEKLFLCKECSSKDTFTHLEDSK